MPSEAARLDPEGRGAARRGGCFNPPQYHPETNLLGFRVLIWTPAGRVIGDALERAKTTSPERKRLKRIRICILRRFERKESQAPATSLGRLTPLQKETRAPTTQLLEACAGRQGVDGWLRRLRREHAAVDSSGEGCSDLIASAGRALQLEQVEWQKRLPRESCGCTGLSPKLHCARLGRPRARLGFASGLRARSCFACEARKGQQGADGCNDFERALGQNS